MTITPPSRVERDLVVLFNILAFLGFFSIVAVLLPTLLSPHVKRSRVWFGVLLSWLLYSISYLLLIGQQIGPKPSLGLCMFQATLIYATSPLCAVATTCFAFDFFIKLSTIRSEGKLTSRRTTRTLIFFPWILALVIAGEVILSVNDASKVQRNSNHFYCHITSLIPFLINTIVIFTCVLIITPLESILLYRNWTYFRRLSRTRARIALSTLVRLALLGFIIILSLVLTIINATPISHSEFEAIWHIVLISLPVLSALCFGTQRDILGAWIFWRKEPIPAITLENVEARNDNNSRTDLSI